MLETFDLWRVLLAGFGGRVSVTFYTVTIIYQCYCSELHVTPITVTMSGKINAIHGKSEFCTQKSKHTHTNTSCNIK